MARPGSSVHHEWEYYVAIATALIILSGQNNFFFFLSTQNYFLGQQLYSSSVWSLSLCVNCVEWRERKQVIFLHMLSVKRTDDGHMGERLDWTD